MGRPQKVDLKRQAWVHARVTNLAFQRLKARYPMVWRRLYQEAKAELEAEYDNRGGK
jgi:hypothetical protein